MFLLRFFYHTLFTDYFYRPYRSLVWHPLYSDKRLTTEERRRMRDESLPDEWTYRIWCAALRHWNHKCAGCQKGGSLQHDHLVPVAHRDCPGRVPSNLIPLCKACNKDKSAQDFTTWYKKRFGKFPAKAINRIYEWQVYCLKQGWR